MSDEAKVISVSNLVSGRTGEGLVQLEYDGQVLAQLRVGEAREVARHLCECAAVAETEAMLMRFFQRRLHFDQGQAVQVLADFRAQRGT